MQKGDTVTVTAFGLYPQAQQHGFLFSLGSFLAGLLHPASPPPPGLDGRKRPGLPLLQVGVAAGLASIPQLSGGVPQAYLRVLVFNRDSALVDQQTRQLTQAAQGNYERLNLQLVLPQDGYVSAYVGSQSDVDVFFDDVRVEHRPGLLVQETQYDPWGLSLAGLDYSSPGIQGLNKYQFNGKERQPDLGLGWSDYGARLYNHELGLFHVLDRFADKYPGLSSYTYVAGNPINSRDFNGDFIISIHYEITRDVLAKFGYSADVSDRLGYYSSYYADRPSNFYVQLNNFAASVLGFPIPSNKDGLGWDRGPFWDDNATLNSQRTESPQESTRHSMQGDFESIGQKQAVDRGQRFGWDNIFEAAKGGTPDKWGTGSKEARAFGVGLHALQDSKPHNGVKIAQHSLDKDLLRNPEGKIAFKEAVSLTESAITVTEMLNGNFAHVSNGMTLNTSGMSKEQLQNVVKAA